MTKQARGKRQVSRMAWMLGLGLCCTSCVYTRLLTFKEQLASFDKNVILTHGGCTLEFLEPVIRTGDLSELTGFSPTRVDGTAPGWESHIYSYRNLSSPGETGTPCGLSFTLRFSSNALVALDYPPVIAEMLGTNLVVAAAKAIGKSRLMQRTHQLDWALGSNQTSTLIPSRASISNVLGPAFQAGDASAGFHDRYRFVLEEASGRTHLHPAELNADFRFDPATSLLRHWLISLGNLKLEVDFPGSP